MNDIKRISVVAIVLIVLLRLSIGWQFLYEGIWKKTSMTSARPWTAKGYLANAEGPFRNYFRSMVGDFPQGNDPDDLLWLDYDNVNQSWQDWQAAFTAHYGLSEAQQKSLDRLLDGADRIDSGPIKTPEQEGVNPIEKLPDGIPADLKFSGVLVKPRLEGGMLVLDAGKPLLPKEFDRIFKAMGTVMTERMEAGVSKPTLAVADTHGQPLLDEKGELVREEDDLKRRFAAHLLRLKASCEASLGYRQKLRASLKGDPKRTGVFISDGQGSMGRPDADPDSILVLRYGEITEYEDELKDYEQAHAAATMPYEFEHLSRLKTKLDGLKKKAVGPVKALDASLKADAEKLLTSEQIGRGPLPAVDTPERAASHQAMWGLLIIGLLLIIGFATRIAAVAGAVMLFMFYLAIPPWPGVPQPAGPEHSFIINKNMIEVIALLGIAALPTGSWFGLDGIIRWLFRSGDTKG
ncbi:MAG: DoxX family membrane protein [Planctomycetaceae bacterium]